MTGDRSRALMPFDDALSYAIAMPFDGTDWFVGVEEHDNGLGVFILVSGSDLDDAIDAITQSVNRTGRTVYLRDLETDRWSVHRKPPPSSPGYPAS